MLVFSCCVTNYLKFSSFTQHPFISASVGRSNRGMAWWSCLCTDSLRASNKVLANCVLVSSWCSRLWQNSPVVIVGLGTDFLTGFSCEPPSAPRDHSQSPFHLQRQQWRLSVTCFPSRALNCRCQGKPRVTWWGGPTKKNLSTFKSADSAP